MFLLDSPRNRGCRCLDCFLSSSTDRLLRSKLPLIGEYVEAISEGLVWKWLTLRMPSCSHSEGNVSFSNTNASPNSLQSMFQPFRNACILCKACHCFQVANRAELGFIQRHLMFSKPQSPGCGPDGNDDLTVPMGMSQIVPCS